MVSLGFVLVQGLLLAENGFSPSTVSGLKDRWADALLMWL